MRYRILEDDLIYGMPDNEKFVFSVNKKYSSFVEDDYDNHEFFGLYSDDIYNALDHAMENIEYLCEHDENTSYARESLVNDLKNYLDCLPLFDRDKHSKDIFYLFDAFAYLGMYNELFDIIMHHHREFTEERNTHEEFRAALDYTKRYMYYGDLLLFTEADAAGALKMYQLATLDWSENDDYLSTEVNENYRQELLDKYMEYKFLYDGKVKTVRRRKNLEDPERECRIEYNRILRSIAPTMDLNHLMEQINRFYTKLDKLIYEVRDDNSKRMMLFMAHTIRRVGMLYALGALYENDIDVQREYQKIAVQRIEEVDSDNLYDVKRFLGLLGERSSRQYTIFKRILEMAVVIINVEKIRLYLSVQKGSKEIAYYTSEETLEYMLPQIDKDKNKESLGKLSIMNVAYMNDPTEGKMLGRYLLTDTDAANMGINYTGRRNAAYPYVFMKCFTTRIDDLPMWEMYGGHASGYCVVLNKKYFIEKGGNTAKIPLYRVCYIRKNNSDLSIMDEDNPLIDNLQEVRESLEIIKNFVDSAGKSYKKWFMDATEKILYLFKDADYNHEQELRIIYSFSKRDDTFRFTSQEIPRVFIQPEFYPNIKEIILGPKDENRSAKMPFLQVRIEEMCEKTGRDMPALSMSAIEYR